MNSRHQNLFQDAKDLFSIKEASVWATDYLGKTVTPSNISYLIQYGRIAKIGDNGGTQISKKELLNYYNSYNGKRQQGYFHLSKNATASVHTQLTKDCRLSNLPEHRFVNKLMNFIFFL